jgi:acetolactate synthase-1/2/3 large subunit
VRDLQESWQRYQRELDAWLVNYDAPVHPLEVIYAIQKTMDTDAIVLAGEGANRIWTTSYLRMPTENSWVISSNFACMGLATAGAFGVKAGCPDRQVICVTGDGAFQMQLQELPVAIQHKLPITWVVLNNNCLGWIKWRQEVVTDSRIIDVDFRPNWDFVKAAEAAGCFGVRVDRKADLQGALQQAFERNRRGQAAVVEVMTLELEMAPGFLAHMGYGEPFTD